MKQCVLYDRVCIDCGECERCDLDPNKKCDNCMRCINGDAAYRAIAVDGFRLRGEEQKDEPQASSEASGDGLDWDALLSDFDS